MTLLGNRQGFQNDESPTEPARSCGLEQLSGLRIVQQGRRSQTGLDLGTPAGILPADLTVKGVGERNSTDADRC